MWREMGSSPIDRPPPWSIASSTFDDFVILNGPYRRYIGKLLARALWAKIRPPRTVGADRRERES